MTLVFKIHCMCKMRDWRGEREREREVEGERERGKERERKRLKERGRWDLQMWNFTCAHLSTCWYVQCNSVHLFLYFFSNADNLVLLTNKLRIIFVNQKSLIQTFHTSFLNTK